MEPNEEGVNVAGDREDNFISGTEGPDKIRGKGGDDKLAGNQGNDRVYGNGGNDKVLGGSGDDVINGGIGQDTLTGGTGRDTFEFGGRLGATVEVDTVKDFEVPVFENGQRVSGDLFDFSKFDPDPITPGDQELAFSANGQAAANSVWAVDTADGRVRVLADVTGDGEADVNVLVENPLGMLTADAFTQDVFVL